jgi:hypothetical protein
MSNIQKCKSCRGNLFTPSQPCITQECIQNTKCSEIIDAACIAYSGQDLLLCQEYNLILQNDNVEVALQKLFAAACDNCAMSVEVTSVEGSYPSLTAAVTNGTGPYTYNWSIAQGPFVGHDILGDTDLNTLDLETIGANSILANYPTTCNYLTVTNNRATSRFYEYTNCAGEELSFTLTAEEESEIICVQNWNIALEPEDIIDDKSTICDQRELIKSTVVRLDVTDSKGCVKSVYYDYSCDCYVQTQDPEGVYTEYVGGNLKLWDLPTAGVNFLDRDDTTITCSELKSFGCITPSETLYYEYREKKDDFYKATSCLVTSEQSSLTPEQIAIQCAPDLPVDYSPWLPNGLADQTIVNKGRLSLAKIDFGCPEYTFWIWNNVHYTSLNGDRIVDRLPTVKDHMIILSPINLISEIPTIGTPGDIVRCDEANNFYAWDPTLNQYTSELGQAIADILNLKRAKRDAQLKAWNELMLAQESFLLCVETLPLHRYKYELI